MQFDRIVRPAPPPRFGDQADKRTPGREIRRCGASQKVQIRHTAKDLREALPEREALAGEAREVCLLLESRSNHCSPGTAYLPKRGARGGILRLRGADVGPQEWSARGVEMMRRMRRTLLLH